MKLSFMLMFTAIFTINLVGCATPQTHKIYEQDYQKPTFSGVSVSINDGYVNSDSGTTAGGIYYSYTDKTAKFFVDELRNTGLFDSVEVNNGYVPLRASISLQRANAGSQSWYTTKFFFHILTLMTLPIEFDYEYLATIDVYYKGEKFKRYMYERNSTELPWIFLLRDIQEETHNVIISIVSEFAHDLSKDRTQIDEKALKSS